VHHLTALVDIEMRDLEGGDRFERQRERRLELFPARPASEIASEPPQRPEHLRAIEALPLTVFAETRS
jgi:hypothetical protein